jgi:hypothetical protein
MVSGGIFFGGQRFDGEIKAERQQGEVAEE